MLARDGEGFLERLMKLLQDPLAARKRASDVDSGGGSQHPALLASALTGGSRGATGGGCSFLLVRLLILDQRSIEGLLDDGLNVLCHFGLEGLKLL